MNSSESAPRRPNEDAPGDPLVHRLCLLLAIAGACLLLLMPTPEGMLPAAQRLAAVTFLMAVLWVTQAIPMAATALVPLAAYPLLGIQSAKDVGPAYMDASIWLFFGGFVIALGIEKWNLHRRMALHIVQSLGTSPRRIVLGFMLATAFLSMWISNTASSMLMLPIALALLTMLSASDETTSPAAISRLGIALMLGIAYSASIGGLATLVGTPTNIAYLTQARKLFPDMPVPSMGEWLMVFLPLSAAMLGATFVVLTWRLPRRLGEGDPGRDYFAAQIRALGKPSAAERVMLMIFVTTAALWIFRKPLVFQIDGEPTTLIPGWGPSYQRVLEGMGVEAGLAGEMLHDATVAMLMALLLFCIPIRVEANRWQRMLDWSDVEGGMPWGILLLLGGGFAMAKAFGDTGLSAWIGAWLAATLQGASPLMLIAAICLLMTFLTEFTSNVATVSTLMPILAGTAVALDLDPRLLMIPAAVTASCAFMLPIATPPNAIIFSSGRVTMQEMVLHGFLLNLIGVALVTAITFLLLVPVLGIRLP